MKKYLLVLLSFVLLMSSSSVFGQNKSEKIEIKSQEVKGVTYSMEVLLPGSYDSTKKYPIIYITDWWYGSRLVPGLLGVLNFVQKIEPVIIVGIEIKSSSGLADWTLDRGRDLTPSNVPAWDSLSKLPAGTSGGAKHFLSFIKKELIPTVEKKYTSDTNNRGYVGYSFGGLFGTYILLNEPQLFKKYLIGSPSLWWDDQLLAKELKKMKAENLKSIKAVFLSVEEEGTQLQSYSQIREQLLKKKPDSMQLETVIILDEDHMTALPSTIIKGLKFLYGI
ncbi:MAG: alpha/beta hydrolase-fold protein [Acidobacteriota bacterium]